MKIRTAVLVMSACAACGSEADPFAAAKGTSSGEAPAPAPAVAPPAVAAPAPAAPADPGFGEVAFKTFESGKTRIVFTTPTKSKVTWRNMAGSAVNGAYVQTGRELVVTWDPAATNYGSKSETFRQMGPCSMARYERIDAKGNVHDDSPMIYQQIKPRCDTIRLTK